MTKFPTLKTSRCILEEFTDRHLTERYVSWLQDTEVTKFSEQRHKQHDINSCRAYMQSFINTGNYLIAIIAQNPSLGHIGNISIDVDKNNEVADIGILLGEKNIWGQGYGVEAWEAICRFLFFALKVRKVTAGTMATNTGMLGIMRRTGMIDDGKRARQVLIDGNEVDIVYAALFRENILDS